MAFAPRMLVATIRVALCIAMVLMVAIRLHAQEQFSDQAPLDQQHAALPWLKLDDLMATRDRPLFAPDRRKPAPVVIAPPSAAMANQASRPPQKPQLTLMGIIEAPVGKLVLLRDASTSESIAVRSGERVGQWQVLAESDYTVKLTDGKREYKLEMFAVP